MKNKKGFVLIFTVILFLVTTTIFVSVMANSQRGVESSVLFKETSITNYNVEYLEKRIISEVTKFNSSLTAVEKNNYIANKNSYISKLNTDYILPAMSLNVIKQDSSITGATVSVDDSLNIEIVINIKGGAK